MGKRAKGLGAALAVLVSWGSGARAAYQAPAAGVGLPATPIAAAGAGAAGAIAGAVRSPSVAGPLASVAVAPVTRLRTPQDTTMLLAERAAGMRLRSAQLAAALRPAPAAEDLPEGAYRPIRGTSMAGGQLHAKEAERDAPRVSFGGREFPVVAYTKARARLPDRMPMSTKDFLSDLGWGAFFATVLAIATAHPAILFVVLIGGSILSLWTGDE